MYPQALRGLLDGTGGDLCQQMSCDCGWFLGRGAHTQAVRTPEVTQQVLRGYLVLASCVLPGFFLITDVVQPPESYDDRSLGLADVGSGDCLFAQLPVALAEGFR